MSRGAASAGTAGAVAVTVACLALAGCGTRHRGLAFSPGAAPRIPVTTAVTTDTAAWAVARTGATRSGGTFWQLLARPAHAARWRLVTPPGVADNAGLVLAPAAGGAMTVAFLPSAQLRFTPLATSTDNGTHWSAGLLPAKLAPLPGALAVLPGGRLLAVTKTGVLESGPGAKTWKTLVSLRALAGSAAGRACGLTALTAVAAGPSGTPLIGGACRRHGAIGVFRGAKPGWQLIAQGRHAGLPAPVVVLRLAAWSGGDPTALLQAGTGGRQRYALAGLGSASARFAVSLIASRAPGLAATFVNSGHGLAGVTGGWTAAYAASVPGTQNASGSFHIAARLPAAGASAAFGPGPRLTAFVPAAAGIAVWTTRKRGRWYRSEAIPVSAP